MFETIELGQKISKQEFADGERVLWPQLLETQRALRSAGVPVIIIVSGVEGAGKSEVVNRLTKWLDARGVTTTTFWGEGEYEAQRPDHWRFWRKLPARGRVGIFFGSWYTRPIVDHVFERIDAATFRTRLHQINVLERMLAQDGTLIIKLWFHLSKDRHDKRAALARKRQKQGRKARLTPWEKTFSKRYEDFAGVSEAAIRTTDTGHSPWHLIEAGDRRYRDLRAGQLVLDAIRRRLEQPAANPSPPYAAVFKTERNVLDTVDLSQRLERAEYKRLMRKWGGRLREVTWSAWQRRRASVVVFEGWDAAGKGGAIRRLVASVDARLFEVIPIAAPTTDELAQHYLWRFWQHIPRDGDFRLFDRSWYGRVLVERVEGFATPDSWRRAYREINHFEEQLADHGHVVTKFWLHLSPEEQLRRFEERQVTPWKKHKITDDDWRNRDRWSDYREAVSDMITHTSTAVAPWVLIAGDDKLFARVQVLKTVTKRLEAALRTKKG